MQNIFGGYGILALLFMCACICFMFQQITNGFKDAADMREPAIALAARSVSQRDYPAQSALFYDNKKQRVGISLLCEVFFS